MPTTYRHLYDQIYGFEHLLAAYRRARRGKRSRPDVAAFEFRCEDELLRLSEELREGSYQPGRYRRFYAVENGKRRVISAAPFRDRVVHHALCAIIEPLLECRFIFDSYASRPNKGTHAALHRAQHFARGHRYALQLDVREFFPSIDHSILRRVLTRHIADPRILDLIDRILADGANELREAYTPIYFPGDDLFAKASLLAASRLEPLLVETSDLTAIFVASVRKLQLET
jgi:retron-type reverse transcriptase